MMKKIGYDRFCLLSSTSDIYCKENLFPHRHICQLLVTYILIVYLEIFAINSEKISIDHNAHFRQQCRSLTVKSAEMNE